MEKDVKEIDEITFGVFSPEEVRKLAVCVVDNPKLGSQDKNLGYNTVYDPRMGVIENGKQCATCNQGVWECSGHFGVINLNVPIIHPMYYKQVVNLLRCFCIKCYKLLITEEQIMLNNLNRVRGVKRFTKILEKLEKNDMCIHCSHPQPDIKYSIADNVISMVYKDKKEKISIILQVEEIKKIFDNIMVEDVKLLGFNPDLVQPRNLILTAFPVIPTCFVENTIVLTDNGYKYIQNVEKNDKLYTHKGNFQKINDFQSKIYTGEMINIKTSYHPNIISCTPEHPFYVKQIDIISRFKSVNGKTQRYKEKKIGEAEWINAGDLKPNHFIGMKINTKSIIPEFNFEKNINQFATKNVSKILNNHDEWFLLGYYVGDGWCDFNRKGRFYLSLHDKDFEFISKLLNKLNISFYIRKKTKHKMCDDKVVNTNEEIKKEVIHDTSEHCDCEYFEDKCESFECQNIILWNILKDFGHLASNKKIPSWVQDAPKEYIQSFLDGYCKADGHDHPRNQIQLKTVSTDLAFSVQLLYMKLGKLAGICYGKKPKSTKKRDGKMIISKHRAYNTSIVKERSKDLNIYHIEDDYMWFKITKNEKSFVKDVKVYNFEVDKDNSYCVENLISHNCCRPFVVADGNICDDDLTIQLVEIIKANNHLEQVDGAPLNDSKKQKYLQSLKFRIATYFNNSCLAPDTPVLLWDGSVKRADEIEIGDELIGDDGEKRTVQVTCAGEDEMYEISQEKGESYIVNSNHYLTLKYSGHKSIFWVKPNKVSPLGSWWMKWFDSDTYKVKNKIVSVTLTRNKEQSLEEIKKFKDTVKYDEVFDIKVKDYLKLSKTVTRCLMGLKLGNPINWDKKEVLIDPYILGMWLGDGNSDCKGFTSADIELIEEWKKWAKENEADVVLHPHKLTEKNKNINYTYKEHQVTDKNTFRPDIHFGIKSSHNVGYDRKHPSPLKDILKKYDLFKNKHIPDDYLYNDVNTRMQLLAGIIDTDGYVEDSAIYISQSIKREKFIRQVLYLAKTLGFNSSIREKISKKNGKESLQLEVYISGYGVDKIPTKLLRKEAIEPNRNCLCSNIKIKSVGFGKYNGFIIDKNHRFLLGDFTVTHNSGRAKHTTNGRVIKGIKERLTGKDGLFRSNLSGKRCEQTARTVIGPDPTLKTGQLAVPPEIANNLTIPEQVTAFNYDYLTKLVNEGKVNYILKDNGQTRINLENALFFKGTRLNHGDIIERLDENGNMIEIVVNNGKELLKKGDKLKRNGEYVTDLKYPERRTYQLNIGDICERRLKDGDIVLLNRQPTQM